MSRPVSFGFVAYRCQLEVSLWAVHCEHGLLTLGTWHASLKPGLQGHGPLTGKGPLYHLVRIP